MADGGDIFAKSEEGWTWISEGESAGGETEDGRVKKRVRFNSDSGTRRLAGFRGNDRPPLLLPLLEQCAAKSGDRGEEGAEGNPASR